MKTKKFNKKLTLNKETIAHLNNGVMHGARAGVATDDTCNTCNPYTYCLGCPTLMCPDHRTEGDCPPDTTGNTAYVTCVGNTCVCVTHTTPICTCTIDC